MSKHLHHRSNDNSGINKRLSSRQVAKLMTDYYDGQLSEAKIRELGELIDSDHELCREFAEQGYFHAQLYHIILGNELLDNNNDSNIFEGEEVTSEKTGTFLPPFDLGDSGKGIFASFSTNHTFLRSFSWIGISLLGCMAIGFACLLFVGGENDAPNNGSVAESEYAESEYVAKLRWLSSANGSDDSGSQTSGSIMLVKDETLRIQNEDVQIQFGCGALVTLHGPAVFRIVSEKLARLEYGSLEAKVPPQAIGFLIDTPATRVIDLGTEFAVTVAANGNTNINVLNGEVEAEPYRPLLTGDELRHKLFEGDSLRLSPPVSKSFRVDFDTPDALDAFDIVRPDPAMCLLDPAKGLLTLKTQMGSICEDKDSNKNILVVSIPDCDFDAVLRVKNFEPTQQSNHLSLATFNDQRNIYRISYWVVKQNHKRGFTFTKEENARHHFVQNDQGEETSSFDMEDRPFRLRLVREGNIISTYWGKESGPWFAGGQVPCNFVPQFVGFFAAEGSNERDPEFVDCVIDSFELKLTSTAKRQ